MAISIDTVKDALRIDYSDDDAEFTRLIAAAIAWVERYTNVGLTSASRTLVLPSFVDTNLPMDPYTALTSVTYYNSANVLTTMPSTSYYVDRSRNLPTIRFIDFPDTYVGTQVTVTYVAGYATEPADMVQAVISIVGLWYNNPEAAQPVALTPVPLGALALLDHYRVKGPFS